MRPIHQPSTRSSQGTDQHLPIREAGHCLTSFSVPTSPRKKERGVWKRPIQHSITESDGKEKGKRGAYTSTRPLANLLQELHFKLAVYKETPVQSTSFSHCPSTQGTLKVWYSKEENKREGEAAGSDVPKSHSDKISWDSCALKFSLQTLKKSRRKEAIFNIMRREKGTKEIFSWWLSSCPVGLCEYIPDKASLDIYIKYFLNPNLW